jgi:hypothetical protein
MRLQDARITRIKGLGVGLLSAALLGLLVTASGSARAQEDRDAAKPQQAEPKQDEAKPREEQAPKDMKAPREEPAKGQEARPEANDKGNGMKPEKAEARPQENNGGGNHGAAQQGRRIPDQKFQASFGPKHTFRVQKTVIVEGQPRFQYSGLWFNLAQPWPTGWDYNDNCYIDFINGEYVLIDMLHPGVQIVVLVVG